MSLLYIYNSIFNTNYSAGFLSVFESCCFAGNQTEYIRAKPIEPSAEVTIDGS